MYKLKFQTNISNTESIRFAMQDPWSGSTTQDCSTVVNVKFGIQWIDYFKSLFYHDISSKKNYLFITFVA